MAWFDPQQRTVLLARQRVQQSVGPLAHVADPLMQISQQRFAAGLLPILVEYDPRHVSASWNLAFA